MLSLVPNNTSRIPHKEKMELELFPSPDPRSLGALYHTSLPRRHPSYQLENPSPSLSTPPKSLADSGWTQVAPGSNASSKSTSVTVTSTEDAIIYSQSQIGSNTSSLLAKEPPRSDVVREHSPRYEDASSSLLPPPAVEVALNAIERLQTQTSQNSGALAAHTRDIRRGEESLRQLDVSLRREFAAQLHRQTVDVQRVDQAVARLSLEMQSLRQLVESLSHKITLGGRATTQQEPAVQRSYLMKSPDTALELMAQQIATVSRKTNEINDLKITLEILKTKLQRLEGEAAATESTQHSSEPSTFPETRPISSDHNPHVPSPKFSQVNSSPRTLAKPQAARASRAPGSEYAPEENQSCEPVQLHSAGWAAINSDFIHSQPAGLHCPADLPLDVRRSPKRQKTIEPEEGNPCLATHHRLGGDISEQPYANGRSSPDALKSPTPKTKTAMSPEWPSYSSNGQRNGSVDSKWRASSQRPTGNRPRGRPRGSGSGSRVPRGRKSLPAQYYTKPANDIGVEDLYNVSGHYDDSRDGNIHISRTGRDIARRGSGGGCGRANYIQHERSMQLGMQGVASKVNIELADPSLHVRKTRSKPVRNADGILIRKDGQPDMRSQSSAANLRKAHIRKEEYPEQRSPSHVLHAEPSAQYRPIIQSTDPQYKVDPDSSIKTKHQAIMRRIFPPQSATSTTLLV